MNRKFVVSILALILALVMVLSLVVSVLPLLRVPWLLLMKRMNRLHIIPMFAR